jgi:DnaJ-class molecular chaperone
MNCYELLGVSHRASEEQIKSAWRLLAAKHHPDKGGDPELFDRYRKAFEEAISLVDTPLPDTTCDVCGGSGNRYVMHGWLKVPVMCLECDGSGKI